MAQSSSQRQQAGSHQSTGNTNNRLNPNSKLHTFTPLLTVSSFSLQDSNFSTALELAVRFGKTLLIQEVDGVEPVLYPLLRGDLIAQGPRFVVQVGDKVIDYNEEFRLFLTTRNPSPDIPPDAASIITMVNFTTTKAGLTGQLLANTIQNEKPELEVRKTELLKQEEDLNIELAKLEDALLEVCIGNFLKFHHLQAKYKTYEIKQEPPLE